MSGEKRTHQVFISYANSDKPTADAICHGLEASGIRCWIAPRDVPPGELWDEAIVDAITNCEAFVLVFTSASNVSSDVKKEVVLGLDEGKVLIPFRLDTVQPSKGLRYQLAAIHWLDALTPPLEGHISALAARLRRVLEVDSIAGISLQAVVAKEPPTPPLSRATAAPVAKSEPAIPAVINVPAGGSLPAAVKNAAPGSTLQLAAGEYAMDGELRIDKPLSIVGVDRDRTRVTAPGTVVIIAAENVRVSGIWFECRRDQPGDAMRAESSGFEIVKCRASGGLWEDRKGGDVGGNGLVMCNAVAGKVSDSQFIKNDATGIGCANESIGEVSSNECSENRYGIFVVDSARPKLSGNTCRINEVTGVSYYSVYACGEASDNLCEGNKLHGFFVTGSASPKLSGNTCRDNGDSGICYEWQSSGEASNNVCEGNKFQGFSVSGSASPKLSRNTCRRNGDSGIAYLAESSGEASDNLCESNKLHGIALLGLASPRILSNTCRGNGNSGIAYLAESSGEASGNLCTDNNNGVAVSAATKPMLAGNTCRGNKYSGFLYYEQASGEASDNVCEGNKLHGFSVSGSANPKLFRNTCQANGDSGITYSEKSSGEATSNLCEDNERCGLRVEGSASPRLSGNISRGNKLKGICVERTAHPQLIDNITEDGCGQAKS